ncbi:MAG: chemotaxis protein CheA [Pseudomonadales bacterium]
MSIDSDMAEIAQIFIDESLEGIGIMESGLLNLEPGAADSETMNSIFRAAHSIKGGGATFGFTDISDFAHHVETLLDEMRQGQRDVTQAGVDLLLKSVDCLSDMISGVGDGAVDTTQAKVLQKQLEEMLETSGHSDANATAEATISDAPAPVLEETIGWHIDCVPSMDFFKSGSDPLNVFRELQLLCDAEISVQGVEQLDFSELNPEQCHLSWHIKLNDGIDKEVIDEVFSWVEDECELTFREIKAPTPPIEKAPLPVVDAVAPTENKAEEKIVEPVAQTKVSEPSKATEKPSKPAAKAAGSSQEGGSIRVNIDKVDALINLVGELVITQSMLSRFDRDFDFTQLHSLREGLTQLSRTTRELQESVMAIRMLPISFAFSRFPRLVRDTSNTLGKLVDLKVSGEGTEVDKTVLEKIGDPLVHLVRNSLDHGLESPEKRLAAGKPETGVLELNAFHEGGNIIIEVVDDGAGINKDRVLEKARERGLVAADETPSDDRINNLIFMAGFSTVETVSDLSGRGVGMDVVRRNISDLGGNVAVKSEMGVGSTFTITLPLTLAILDGQLVRVGDQSYIISLVSIIETIQCAADHVNAVVGQAEMFKLRDSYLPILRLHELFGIEADSSKIDDGLLVVVEANGQRLGIFVDDLLEQQQVVIKSLEANFRKTQGISGATILSDGNVALIVDVPGLMQLFFDKQKRIKEALVVA